MSDLFTTGISWTASLGQERHVRYQERFPESAAFNVPTGATFTGDVDLPAMATAIRAVASRHDPLLSSFVWGPGGLRAHRGAPDQIPVAIHDLRDCGSEAERAQALAGIGAAEAGRPFALGQEQATRAHLARLSDDEVALVLNVHHASFDGWSAPVFFAELADCYQASIGIRAAVRPAPVYRYVDFAMGQRKVWRAGGYREQMDYWRQELRDPAPPSAWPRDGVDPKAPWWQGDMAWASLPVDLIEAVQAAARSAGTTLFAWTLAVYRLALHRFLGAPAVAVGTPYAARTQPQWSELIGFFANTLVVQSTLEPTLSLRELIGQTHQQSIRAHRNQDVPYGMVVEMLEPPVWPDRTPYFQTMFIVQNTPLPDPSFGPLRLRTTKIVTGSARYDLTFCLGWRRGQLALELESRPALISQETAIQLAQEFFGLLAASVLDPHVRVDRIRPLPVGIGVRRGRERAPGVDGLFEGIVGDWRRAVEE